MTNTGFTTCIPLARNGAAILLAAGMLLAPAAQADWYFGAKTGPMMIDVGGFDDPTNVGVLVGHEWGVVAGDIGVEAELTRTLDDGEFAGQDVKVDTQGLYAAFRTAGPVYLIGKAGVVRNEVEVGSSSGSDTGTALGAGVGFSIGIAQFELEYTRIDDDIDFLSLGLRF
ncbi:cell envelope biogenesis protein OmpA [Sulfurifustis variabilis]|uniref:Cell envelope biogenesis protein OmpA n=1 Tax=Sulfurifustis variabilis TaxID=1675686 RepID=A0A1B4V6N6_9GAMM|nr:outer membrane beta-barrel protein [Sulfurifustis variabilis]BAU49213.1 cell envelope biogenesis protein OmpA [Sulfurifustis variabilis]